MNQRAATLTIINLGLLLCSLLLRPLRAQKNSSPVSPILVLPNSEYLDRVQAIWMAQMIAQRTASRFEHQPASVLVETPLSHLPGYAPVDVTTTTRSLRFAHSRNMASA